MALLDTFSSSSKSEGDGSSARGVNDIPAPRSDANVNAPPPQQHNRVIDFVKEQPNAKYVFDSRRNNDQTDAELCRIDPQGGRSCIKLALHSAALFKSMQSLEPIWNVTGFSGNRSLRDALSKETGK